MQKKDRETTSLQEINDIIQGSPLCRLAMARDNRPYLIPLCFGYDGKALYLHTGREGEKICYFEANNRVCFEFEGNVHILEDWDDPCKWSFSYETVIGFGTICELIEPAEKNHALNQIMQHYSGKNWTFKEAIVSKARIWKITIDSMTGKRSKDRVSRA